jgi:hypothetical protein
MQAHFMALADEVHEGMQRDARTGHGSDHVVLVERLERQLKQFCTLQAWHHALECAMESLRSAADGLLTAELEVSTLVRIGELADARDDSCRFVAQRERKLRMSTAIAEQILRLFLCSCSSSLSCVWGIRPAKGTPFAGMACSVAWA